MQKYIKILIFAIKEKMEYKTAFIFWIFFMLFNNSSFLFIFWILTDYLKSSNLSFLNFVLIHWIISFYYWITHWLFANIWKINEIIEKWKIDYYLSFPISPLKFLIFKDFDEMNLWDVFFSFILLSFYIWSLWLWFFWWFILFLKILFCLLFWLMIISWLFFITWSISFFLDKWSSIASFFNSFMMTFWSYPPQIYNWKIWILFITIIFWIYPASFLPYLIINWWEIREYFLLWFLWILLFFWWIKFFYFGLKNYSSWNLVNQM